MRSRSNGGALRIRAACVPLTMVFLQFSSLNGISDMLFILISGSELDKGMWKITYRQNIIFLFLSQTKVQFKYLGYLCEKGRQMLLCYSYNQLCLRSQLTRILQQVTFRRIVTFH